MADRVIVKVTPRAGTPEDWRRQDREQQRAVFAREGAGYCDCPEPALAPDDDELYCWRCHRFLAESEDDE